MKRVLVTGGGGCLGSHLVEVLHDKKKELGVTEIVVFDLLENVRWASDEDNKRIKGYCSKWIVGSILDVEAVRKAIENCTVVIHVASLVDTGTVSKEKLYEVNVKGSENVLAVCQMEESVKALVYSSTFDTVFFSTNFEGINGENEESLGYSIDDPKKYCKEDVYAITKTIAEKSILGANLSLPHLRTAAVRPLGLYGERDSVHIGSVLEAALNMGSSFRFRFGDGSAVFQHVYARNCALMHALCAKKLVDGDDQVAGEFFYGIDDTKIKNFFDFFEPYLAAKGYKIPTIRLPFLLSYALASVAEDIFIFARKMFPNQLNSVKFTFSRKAVQSVCINQYFITDKARRLLGYVPDTSPMEARRRSIAYFSKLESIFPRGPYHYPAGKYDYDDDGSDYRPALKKEQKNKTNQIMNLIVFGGAISLLLVIGMSRKN